MDRSVYPKASQMINESTLKRLMISKFVRISTIFIIIFLLPSLLLAKREHPEKWYQQKWCLPSWMLPCNPTKGGIQPGRDSWWGAGWRGIARWPFIQPFNYLTNKLFDFNKKRGLFLYWKQWKTENTGFGWTRPLNILICRLISGVSEIQLISNITDIPIPQNWKTKGRPHFY